MFKIRQTAAGYVATLEKTGDNYFIGNVKPTQGYPKKAKYPYKGDVSLMKSQPDETGVNQMTFIRLRRGDAAARTIISALTPELCTFIERNKAIDAAIKEEEEKQYSLMENNLDDLMDFDSLSSLI